MELHNLALLFPAMSDEEFAELKSDIKRNGLLEPIITYQGKIIDGRHRYQACTELGIEPEFEEYTGDSPSSYVVSKNMMRRQLTSSQKAAIAVDMLPFFEEENEKKRREKISVYRETGETSPQMDTSETVAKIPPSKSRDIVGEKVGISGRYISEAKKLKEENPEAFEAVKRGEVNLSETKKGIFSDVDRIQAKSSNRWYTPKIYLDAAREVLGEFDCDPASSEEANKLVNAKQFFSEEIDGLKQEWIGKVWLNPPYGGIAAEFVNKLIEQFNKRNTTEAILLVNANSTDTKWFVPLFEHTICFTNHRINFESPDNIGINNSTHGSAFVYLGRKNISKFKQHFEQFGAIVRKI